MTVLLHKVIKPKKLNTAGMRTQLLGGAVMISKEILLDYELTTAFWKHHVKFERLVDFSDNRIEILVGTDDKIYGYVDKGTQSAGLVVARPGKVFAFPEHYEAHTTPDVPVSMKARGRYGDVIFTKRFHHKGIKARNFSKLIEKKWKRKLNKEVAQIYKDMALTSGHNVR